MGSIINRHDNHNDQTQDPETSTAQTDTHRVLTRRRANRIQSHRNAQSNLGTHPEAQHNITFIPNIEGVVRNLRPDDVEPLSSTSRQPVPTSDQLSQDMQAGVVTALRQLSKSPPMQNPHRAEEVQNQRSYRSRRAFRDRAATRNPKRESAQSYRRYKERRGMKGDGYGAGYLSRRNGVPDRSPPSFLGSTAGEPIKQRAPQQNNMPMERQVVVPYATQSPFATSILVELVPKKFPL
ncbi:hypothetical protein Cgig2_031353 [Carnegiea gigantea]|uniref:Uncharacterized protein n=1 Tax=Carnegiea gigantea TaxID=171969 RepID=A0A9Q1GI33_9CARY|nr:hypothetical protein Cgig2_031353 [Carnegiea gigantea]